MKFTNMDNSCIHGSSGGKGVGEFQRKGEICGISMGDFRVEWRGSWHRSEGRRWP